MTNTRITHTKPTWLTLVLLSFVLLGHVSCKKEIVESPPPLPPTPPDSTFSPLDTMKAGVWYKIANASSSPTNSTSQIGHALYFPVNEDNVLRSTDQYLSPSSGRRAGIQTSTDGGFNYNSGWKPGSKFYKFFDVNNDTLAFVVFDEYHYSRTYFSTDGGLNYNGGYSHDDNGPTLVDNTTKAIDVTSTGKCYFITETEDFGYFLGRFDGNSKSKLFADTLSSEASYTLSVVNGSTLFFTRQNTDSAAFYRSTDGGQSFEALNLPTTRQVYGLLFFNTTEGILTADYGELYHTTDAGSTWTKLPFPSSLSLSKLVQQNGKYFILTGDGQIYESSDGLSWTFFDQPPVNGIRHFHYFGTTEKGMIGTDHGLYRKHDGN